MQAANKVSPIDDEKDGLSLMDPTKTVGDNDAGQSNVADETQQLKG